MKYPTLVTLAFLFLLAPKALKGQVDNQYIEDRYERVYRVTPSMLSHWEYDDWSYFGGSFNHAEGYFRDIQKGSKRTSWNFKTESIYRLPNSNWSFYGKFYYLKGSADSVASNLSYHIGRDGSPYYLFQRKTGSWNLQDYIFDVSASNRVSERLSLGFNIEYRGELAHRVVDSRNNQNGLNTKVTLSSTYKLTPSNFLSLNLLFERSKVSPATDNRYYHSPTNSLYDKYIITGLGSYIKNYAYRIYLFNINYGASLNWGIERDESYYAVRYGYDTGDESVINRNLIMINDHKSILNYNHRRHLVALESQNSLGKRALNSSLSLSYLKGSSGEWNVTTKIYDNNYRNSVIEGSFSSYLYSPTSILRRVAIEAAFKNDSRLDRSYGYQFEYSNLMVGGSIELSHSFKGVRASLRGGGSYGKNLSLLHNPNAAVQNLYTIWIADPLLSYLTADFIELPFSLKFERAIGSYFAELNLSALHLSPLKLNYSSGSPFELSDNFREYSLSLKLYF